MDFSPIIGLVAGLGLIVFGILDGGGVMSSFLDPASAAITFGGTLAAALISFPISEFKHVGRHFKIMVQPNRFKPKTYIEKIVDYAQDARRKGLLALEDKASHEKDGFFSNCIMLVVDAIEPAKTKEMLENELNCLESRHAKSWQMYEKIATYAPAYGMIGTLIGLINMLKGLNLEGGAANQLAQGMSLALVTTFYGSLLANLVLMPMAARLRTRHQQEMLCKELVVEGVLAIQAGDNPRNIEERLNAFLTDKERMKAGEQGGEDKSSKSSKSSKPSKPSKKK